MGSRLLGKRLGRMPLRATPRVCGVPSQGLGLVLSTRELGAEVGGYSRFGKRGGTSVCITRNDADTASSGEGEVGM